MPLYEVIHSCSSFRAPSASEEWFIEAEIDSDSKHWWNFIPVLLHANCSVFEFQKVCRLYSVAYFLPNINLMRLSSKHPMHRSKICPRRTFVHTWTSHGNFVARARDQPFELHLEPSTWGCSNSSPVTHIHIMEYSRILKVGNCCKVLKFGHVTVYLHYCTDCSSECSFQDSQTVSTWYNRCSCLFL